MDGEAAEVRDPAADVRALEAHRPGALAVDLDQEDAERVRVGLRARDLREDLVATLRSHGGEERLDVLVRHELDEEVGVVRARAPDRHLHAGSSCARTPKSRCPEASATPSRISASPASSAA